MRRLRIAAIAAIATCGIGFAWIPVAAAGTQPHGILTSTEYSELSEMYSGLLHPAKGAGLKTLAGACYKAGTSTSLLATQRSSCVAEISNLSYIESFSSAQKKCDTAIAASAGAAKQTAADALAALEQIACLNPVYQQIGHLASASYSQEVSARQIAIGRGFTGVCLETLVDTVPQLQAEHQLALTAGSVAQDSAGLTKLAARKTLPSSGQITKFESDSTAFAQAFEALSKLSGPTKLSVCRHQ